MTSSIMHGGLRLESHKKRSTQSALRMLDAPRRVVLPLNQHAGTPARPVVRVGDRVLRGQPIGEPQGEISAWLHASVTGRVIAIEPRATPGKSDGDALCIVIDNDGSADAALGEPVNIESLDPQRLCEHIALGGMVGLGGAVFPTAPKLLRGQQAGQMHLLLNGAECEPWISCDDLLMRERAADILRGASIMRHALQAVKCTIVIEDDKPDAQRALRAAQSAYGEISILVVPTIYPAGGENQLITAAIGLEVPSGGLPSDIGIVCHNVGTAAAVARWVDSGEPLTRRIVTVTGSGVSDPGNFDVVLGTSIAELIAHASGDTNSLTRLLMGGSMMGLALPNATLPVVKGSNCIVAALPVDLLPRGAQMPCIRCGNCEEVCPALLLPQQLDWFATAGDLQALEQHGLLDCIECGCCDHVCPSQIPLTRNFRDAKPALIAQHAARSDAVLARARFEARDARLLRLDSERREKLAAKRRSVSARADE